MLPTSIRLTSNNDFVSEFTNEDLHIVIFDPDNITQSLQDLSILLQKRQRNNKETWLLDIEPLNSLKTATKLFENLSIDFDDDIILLQINQLWEIYKINRDLIVQELGSWTNERGILINNPEKWIRRGNLMVQ